MSTNVASLQNELPLQVFAILEHRGKVVRFAGCQVDVTGSVCKKTGMHAGEWTIRYTN